MTTYDQETDAYGNVWVSKRRDGLLYDQRQVIQQGTRWYHHNVSTMPSVWSEPCRSRKAAIAGAIEDMEV